MTASYFAVMGVQLGYAAITSRLLPPDAFGAYAVALSGVGVIGMLGGSSLGQAAARRDHDSVHLDRSLITLAMIVGCSTALLAILLAPLWGRLWGVPESTQVTRVLALGIPFAAISAVLAGILRREGRTSAVAGRTGLSQLIGMAVGLAAVLGIGTAWSLGVASVSGLFVTTFLLSATLPRERLKPARPTSTSIEDAAYGAKSAGMNLLRYGTSVIPAWSIGRFVGSADLGAYNRATTLLTLPLESLQRSFSYSIFPDLRPGGPVARSPQALTDIMILVTWPAVFVGGIGYFAAEPLLLLALGPGWEAAGSIAGLAVLLGIAPMLRIPIGSALEARGQFGITWVGWLLGACAIVLGSVRTAQTGEPALAMLGLLVASAGSTVVYVVTLSRDGDLDWRRWASASRLVVGIQAATSGILAVGIRLLPSDQLLGLAWVTLAGTVEVGLLWLVRRHTSFWKVAHLRGLVTSRGGGPES